MEGSEFNREFDAQSRADSQDPTLLLFPTFLSDKIEVHESEKTGVFLAGPNLKMVVRTAEEAIQLVAIGNQFRAVAPIQCNDLSSRSHSILTFYVESRITTRQSVQQGAPERVTGDEHDTVTELRLGKLHLVDLAGSERLNESKAEGETLVETQNINKSLLALGDVLHALSVNATALRKNHRIEYENSSNLPSPSGSTPGGQTPNFSSESTPRDSRTPSQAGSSFNTPLKPTKVHIPYLNSKLTHLLKDSLGGNTKTVMMCNVSPEMEHYHQTYYTLMYASRAKKVRNFTLVNRVEISDDLLDLSSEMNLINQLKLKLFHEAPKDKYGRKIAPTPAQLKSLGVRPPATTKRLLTLQSLRATDLEYLFFPMMPCVKIRVGSFNATTKKQLYTNQQASYSEVISVEIETSEYQAGIEMEVEVLVQPIATEGSVPIGKGRAVVKAFVTPDGALCPFSIPLTGSFLLNNEPVLAQRGFVTLLGSLSDPLPARERDNGSETGSSRGDSRPTTPTRRTLNSSQSFHLPGLSRSGTATSGELLRSSTPSSTSRGLTRSNTGASGSFSRSTTPTSRSRTPGSSTSATPGRSGAPMRSGTPSNRDGPRSATPSAANGLKRVSSFSSQKGSQESPKAAAGRVPSTDKSNEKPGLLHVKRIVCQDLYTVVDSSTTRQSEMYVILQLGSDKRAIEVVGRQGQADVSFDKNNSLQFDVDLNNLRWESLNIKLFDVNASSTDKLIGEAYTSIHSLGQRRGELVEIPLRIKSGANKSVGCVVIYLRLTKVLREFVGSVSHDASLAQSPYGSFSTPLKRSPTSFSKPTTPKSPYHNTLLPKDMTSGWLTIHSIVAENLNKLKLLGRRTRYATMQEGEGTPRKPSESLGLQDPFITMQVGDAWASHTPVLTNQGSDCVWRDLNMRFFFYRDLMLANKLKFSVYDHHENRPDALIGCSAVSLTTETGIVVGGELELSTTVTNKSGKYLRGMERSSSVTKLRRIGSTVGSLGAGGSEGASDPTGELFMRSLRRDPSPSPNRVAVGGGGMRSRDVSPQVGRYDPFERRSTPPHGGRGDLPPPYEECSSQKTNWMNSLRDGKSDVNGLRGLRRTNSQAAFGDSTVGSISDAVGDHVKVKSKNRILVDETHQLFLAKQQTEEEAAVLAIAKEQITVETALLDKTKLLVEEETHMLMFLKQKMAEGVLRARQCSSDAEEAVSDKAIVVEETVALNAAMMRSQEETRAASAARARSDEEDKATTAANARQIEEERINGANVDSPEAVLTALTAAKQWSDEESRSLVAATDKAIDELHSIAAAISKADEERRALAAARLKTENVISALDRAESMRIDALNRAKAELERQAAHARVAEENRQAELLRLAELSRVAAELEAARITEENRQAELSRSASLAGGERGSAKIQELFEAVRHKCETDMSLKSSSMTPELSLALDASTSNAKIDLQALLESVLAKIDSEEDRLLEAKAETVTIRNRLHITLSFQDISVVETTVAAVSMAREAEEA
eukprot:gene22337-28457_t